MPEAWTAELRPRASSAAATFIRAFSDHPVMQDGDLEALVGSPAAAYRAIYQLTGAGFIEEVTGRTRNRVWAASEVMAELDDLDQRIQAAMRTEPMER